MVFKPWTDVKTPRHLVSDLDDLTPLTESPIPDITFNIDSSYQISEKLLIIPQSLKFIHEAYRSINDKEQLIGTIEIRTPVMPLLENDEDEYSLEEQLYQAHPSSFNLTANTDIEIIQSEKVTFIIVPNFTSLITHNLLAQSLSQDIPSTTKILSITPGQNPTRVNVTQLISDKSLEYSNITKLSPPFYITGISASLLSQTSLPLAVLILQSEGQQGYEKVNDDAIGDVSGPVAEFFGVEKKTLLKSMRKEVGGSVNSFALYL